MSAALLLVPIAVIGDAGGSGAFIDQLAQINPAMLDPLTDKNG